MAVATAAHDKTGSVKRGLTSTGVSRPAPDAHGSKLLLLHVVISALLGYHIAFLFVCHAHMARLVLGLGLGERLGNSLITHRRRRERGILMWRQ